MFGSDGIELDHEVLNEIYEDWNSQKNRGKITLQLPGDPDGGYHTKKRGRKTKKSKRGSTGPGNPSQKHPTILNNVELARKAQMLPPRAGSVPGDEEGEQVEADNGQEEADNEQAEANNGQVDADNEQAEAGNEQAEADDGQVDADNEQAEADNEQADNEQVGADDEQIDNGQVGADDEQADDGGAGADDEQEGNGQVGADDEQADDGEAGADDEQEDADNDQVDDDGDQVEDEQAEDASDEEDFVAASIVGAKRVGRNVKWWVNWEPCEANNYRQDEVTLEPSANIDVGYLLDRSKSLLSAGVEVILWEGLGNTRALIKGSSRQVYACKMQDARGDFFVEHHNLFKCTTISQWLVSNYKHGQDVFLGV